MQKKKQVVSWKTVVVNYLFRRDGGICPLCISPMTPEELLEIDHIIERRYWYDFSSIYNKKEGRKMKKSYGKQGRDTALVNFPEDIIRREKKAVADREEEAEKAADWEKQLEAMPRELTHGDSIFRREGESVLQSWREEEFEKVYHLRRFQDVFNPTLVDYLCGGGE